MEGFPRNKVEKKAAENKFIGIVAALPVEYQVLADRLRNARTENLWGGGGLIYGHMGRYQCVLLHSGCGKILSAAATQWLVDHFDCKYILGCGVGGALLPSVNIGDIVLGERVIEHDYYSFNNLTTIYQGD